MKIEEFKIDGTKIIFYDDYIDKQKKEKILKNLEMLIFNAIEKIS